MSDFNWFPDHTDITVNIGTKPNRIALGTRMPSTQSPCIVSRDRPCRVGYRKSRRAKENPWENSRDRACFQGGQ